MMPLSMEVGLGPGDFVFDVDPATPRKKAFRFGCAHVLRRPGCLNVPNFVKIFQSTAEL